MLSIINKFKESRLFKTVLYICCLVFFSFYVFSIPSFSGRPTLNIISYIGIILLSISSVLYFLLYKRIKNCISFYLLILPVFVLQSSIGTILYSHQFRSWATLVLMLFSFFIFIISFICINNKHLILVLIVSSLFLFTIYFFIHYRDSIADFQSLLSLKVRLGKDFDNVNQLGSYMSIGFSCSLFLLLFASNKYRYYFIISCVSFLLVGYFTGSRTFIVSVFLITIISLFFKLKNHKLVFSISVLLIIVLAIIIINLPPFEFLRTQFIKFLSTLFTGNNSDLSSTQRGVWQLYGIELTCDRLLFGFGQGGFGIASNTFSYSHANFSELLCDFGVIGFVIFNLYIIYSFYIAIKIKSDFKYLILTLAAYFILNGFLSVYYYQKDVYLIFALFYFLNTTDTILIQKIKKSTDIFHAIVI